MTNIIESIRAEYLRYKGLAEGAIDQLVDDDLSAPGLNGGNSIATICWHVSGNLKSRFTEFLTSDGEKPWRSRDEGWKVLLGTLDALTDEQLDQTVTIRGQPHRVHQALHRSLAHTSYHVGQIVYLAKGMRGKDWKYLSIAPGQSDAFTQTLSATGQNR